MAEQQQAQQQEADASMSLVDHLRELRTRLLRSVLLLLAIFVGLFYFANDIYTLVAAPLLAMMPESSSMIAIDVTSPFFAPFKLTLAVAFALGMPVLLYELWAFVAPGLYRQERRAFLPIVASSIVLFYLGVAFAYYVVLPIIVGFFTSIGPSEVAVMTDINSYLGFVLKIFFAFGIAFEIPIAVILLSYAGLVNVDSLRRKRRYIIVGCFALGMLLTPPDIFSQSLLALPMWLLFEVGLFFSARIDTRRQQREQAEEDDNEDEADEDEQTPATTTSPTSATTQPQQAKVQSNGDNSKAIE